MFVLFCVCVFVCLCVFLCACFFFFVCVGDLYNSAAKSAMCASRACWHVGEAGLLRHFGKLDEADMLYEKVVDGMRSSQGFAHLVPWR